ncbi:MAG: hypothetical protein IPO62_12455 [Saprospiraceae bacterium]|nr:hypothetical protein [Saprospiraceae bacterium]MBK9631855.1 hypothetical protein [Saprospiraceae bacterium]
MKLYLRPSFDPILNFESSPNLTETLDYDLVIIKHPSVSESAWKTHFNKMDLGAFKKHRIMDLGEFAGNDSEKMAQTLGFLIDQGICPIVIGGDKELLESLHILQETQMKPYSLSWVNPGLHLSDLAIWQDHFVLKEIQGIAMQRHNTQKQEIQTQLSEITISYLSDFRKSSNSVDPLLRRSNWCFFDPHSIRYSDFPASEHLLVSGLFSEEAASICKMAGAGEKNQLFMISSWKTEVENKDLCDYNISQLVWYYMEGYNQKKLDETEKNSHLTEYVVDLTELDLEICFCKSEITGKWWFKSPTYEGHTKSSILIPCTYDEYLQTIQESIPKRISELLLKKVF